MKINFIFVIILSLTLFNCVSTGENIEKMQETDYKSPDILNINLDKIRNTNNWSLQFKYENVTLETKELSDGTVEKTETNYGYSKSELQLIDSIYYSLKYQYNINIEKNVPADGIIQICALIDQVDINEYYYSIEINFLNNNELLARNHFRKTVYFTSDTDGYSKIIRECLDIILTRLKK
jgi:hypothetical protein